jgi:hypothetical protein
VADYFAVVYIQGEILVLNKLHSNTLITYTRLHVFLCVALPLVVQMQTNVCVTCIHFVVQGFVKMHVAMKQPPSIHIRAFHSSGMLGGFSVLRSLRTSKRIRPTTERRIVADMKP